MLVANELQTELRSNVPSVYKDVLEMDKLLISEEHLLGILADKFNTLWKDQFIRTATLNGIEQFEKLLNITSNDSSESLDFRRARVLNRFSMTPPFTYKFLQNRLNEILGEGSWEVNIDYDTQTLTISAMAADKAWEHEIAVTIMGIKPANMRFVSRPSLRDSIFVGEQIQKAEKHFNYRLGVSWFLNLTPFSTDNTKEVVKMANVSSIQQGLLKDVASFLASDIDHIVINDAYEIAKADIVATQNDNVITVEYTVPEGAVNTAIERVRMYNSQDALLSEARLYVSSISAVLLSHTITISEG